MALIVDMCSFRAILAPLVEIGVSAAIVTAGTTWMGTPGHTIWSDSANPKA